MKLIDAVKRGYRIRHRNWPPYHYAQLKQGELWRFAPHADATYLELNLDDLNIDRGWSLIEFARRFA